MELDDHDGLVAVEAIDHRELPERAVMIEPGHRRLAYVLEHCVKRLGLRCSDPTEVVRQVEVGVDAPTRRGEVQGWFQQPVPEAGSAAAHALQAPEELVPVGRALENEHRRDGEPELRVLLDAPDHRVQVAHVVGLARPVRGAAFLVQGVVHLSAQRR